MNLETLDQFLSVISGYVWGLPTIILLFGVGVYLSFGLRFMTLRNLFPTFSVLWKSRKVDTSKEGDITPFQSLMTALASTVGTGNIAGVATAITLGGPGAIFWMWIVALFGMATKYSESMLGVQFREKNELGRYVGGPMYYIKHGLGSRWLPLAALFAFFGMLAGFGIGSSVQANTVADTLAATWHVPTWVSGVVICLLAGMVIFGGIKRIGAVAAKIVPLMALIYVVGSVLILSLNYAAIPAAFAMIVNDAFTGTAAGGGFAGATVIYAMRYGIARGIFSNEAGMGSEPIAHASARTNDPIQQGKISMIGVFIDTIVLCTMTALIIIISGLWQGGSLEGAALSSAAYDQSLPGFGNYFIAFSLIFFGFSTILGWSHYSERCMEYLFGTKYIAAFRVLYIVFAFVGAVFPLKLIWTFADILNGLMAVPNLIALLLLSPLVFKLTRSAAGK